MAIILQPLSNCSKPSASNAAYKDDTETVKEWMGTTLGREVPTPRTLVSMARDIVNAGIHLPYHISQAVARAIAMREQYNTRWTGRVSKHNLTREERDELVEKNRRHIHFSELLKEVQRLFKEAVQKRTLISLASQCAPKPSVRGNTAVTCERICQTMSFKSFPTQLSNIP